MSEKVSRAASARGIVEVLHFSTNMGLTGCLHKGLLLPRNRLRDDEQLEHIITLNAPFRAEEGFAFDKSENWIDYANLTLSDITYNLFKHSLQWHADKDVYWVIMSFDPALSDDDGVYFTTTNNIYEHTKRSKGLSGFNAMFAHTVRRKGTWVAGRAGTASHLTTCEQAEVLYPEGLDMAYLRKIYVRQGEEADATRAVLNAFDRKDVEVDVSATKFKGR